MRRGGVMGLVLGACALVGLGCDSIGSLSSGLKKKDKKKHDAGVTMVDAGSVDGGTNATGDDGGTAGDDAGTGDAGVMADAEAADSGPNGAPTVEAVHDEIAQEGSSVSVLAIATDPENDPLTFSWTFQLAAAPIAANCAFVGPTDGASRVNFRCDNDAIATVRVTVSDGHNPPVSDEVRIEFRNVPATTQFLRPADGLVVKRDTPLEAAVLIQEPSIADIDECTLFRDDRGDVTRVVKPTPGSDPFYQTCVWPADNFLTQLTGMRHITVRVGERDAPTSEAATNLVVYAADPAEVASGQGSLPVCTTGDAFLNFAVRYDSSDATRPHGFVQYVDRMVGLDFLTQDLDWFVVSRLRPSQPVETIALSGRVKNAGRDCSLLLFARGPKWFEFAVGVTFGEARLRLVCGTDVYDTNPSSILDVDDSPMTPMRPGGEVHIDIPHDPIENKTICSDPANEGADCRVSSMRNVASAVCHAGQCVLTCSQAEGEGTVAADCDGSVDNGCEIDIMSDSANCGWCGHFCGSFCVQKGCKEDL